MAGSNVETSRRFALEHGGPERLELRWGASFRDVRVLFDGVEVATVDRRKIPRDGRKIPLPDGSELSLRLRGLLGFEVLRNEKHVPGSDLDPRRVLRNAALLMSVAALADGALDGVVARRALGLTELTHAPFPTDLTIRLALDAALLLLALPVALGSRIALAVGIAAFASRFGVGVSHEATMLVYGTCTTWLLATHFFATLKRRTPR